MAPKAIVFAGTDGHGAVMGVISARNLCTQGYEVEMDCRWPQTGQPSRFWGETFVSANLDGVALVAVVDVPLPEPDGMFPNAVPDAIQKIAEVTAKGTKVVIVDHHKVAETHYGAARAAGAEVVVASSASTCFYGAPSEFSERWGRVGAVCDLDDAVLPVTEQEEATAAGVDVVVRGRLAEALAAIERDDLAFFAGQGAVPEPPGAVEIRGNVVLCRELTPTWGFKQLSRLAMSYSCDYAVGVDCFGGQWRVIAITSWQSNALPVALKLALARFIGHGKAIMQMVCPAETPDGREQALATADSFIDRLNAEAATEPGSVDEAPKGNGEKPNLFGYVAAFMSRVHVPFFMTLHGWGHVEHVVGHARSLGSLFDLSVREQRLLDWAALFHDIGNGAATVYGFEEKEARARHHEFTFQMLHEWRERGLFRGLIADEDIEAVADLCLRHRKKMPLPEEPRMRLLCVILRVADGMDIDSRRAQRNDEGRFFEDLDLPEESVPHWEGHRAIEALRLVANGGLVFEIVVTDRQKAAFQVAEISQELSCLGEFCAWSVRVVSVDEAEN